MRAALSLSAKTWRPGKRRRRSPTPLGLEFIQYEGGNHNDPKIFDTLSAEERERFMEFYRRCNHTPEDAANYGTMFNSFVAMGGKYPSKFVEAGVISRYGAWGGLRHLSDNNPVWDAVVSFNRS